MINIPSRIPSSGIFGNVWVAFIAIGALAMRNAYAADSTEHTPEGLSWNISAGTTEQSDSDLRDGGEVGLSRSNIGLSVMRQVFPDLAVGASVQYEFDNWDFANPTAFGGSAPWKNVRRGSLGMQLRTKLGDTWQFMVAPTVQYAGEVGADTRDALTYGSTFAFARQFGPDLGVRIGVAALRDIDETRVLPYLGVTWQINENWRLGSPGGAKPPGFTGYELDYRTGPRWDFGIGIGFSQYRFRLDDNGPTLGGVGESRSLPLYGRVSYTVDPRIRFDAYVGESFDNSLSVTYPDGHVDSQSYARTPVVGVSVSISP